MVKVTVLDNSAPYYTIEVSFDGHKFVQQLVSVKEGVELDAQFQAYAEQYAKDWLDAQAAPVEEPAEESAE